MNAPHAVAVAPQASLRELADLAALQRAAWAAPRRSGGVRFGPTAWSRAAERRARAIAALRRLAADPAATEAERALAAERVCFLASRGWPVRAGR